MAEDRVRVLIIDDDDRMLSVLDSLLADEGIEVHTAHGADEALSMVEAGLEVDTVIVDYVMPWFDGVTTGEALRAFLPTAKTILFSSLYDPAVATQARANGFVFLEKTAGLEALLAELCPVPTPH